MATTVAVQPYAGYQDLINLGLPDKAISQIPLPTIDEAILAASAKADGYLRTRAPVSAADPSNLLLTAWGPDLTKSVAVLAAEDLMITRGYNPSLGTDLQLAERAKNEREYLRDYGKNLQNQSVIYNTAPGLTQPAPFVQSDYPQGWGVLTPPTWSCGLPPNGSTYVP